MMKIKQLVARFKWPDKEGARRMAQIAGLNFINVLVITVSLRFLALKMAWQSAAMDFFYFLTAAYVVKHIARAEGKLVTFAYAISGAFATWVGVKLF